MSNEFIDNLRDRFSVPSTGTYFLGNSLGLMPKNVPQMVSDELQRWSEKGVEAHWGDQGWLSIDKMIKPTLSKLIGAADMSEIAVCHTLTVNLHLLLSRFYRPDNKRSVIMVEKRPFPSDWYAVMSRITASGEDPVNLVELNPREDEVNLRTEDIVNEINIAGESLGILVMGGVHYYTGQMLDIATITKAVHKVGGIVIWDLAHAVGIVELQLHDWQVDAAVWCSYKYLNGGPGSPGGMFLHRKYHKDATPPGQLLGWWGHEESTRFEMDNKFKPEKGADSMRLSNISPLSGVCLISSMQIYELTDIAYLRKKSLAMTSHIMHLIDINSALENKVEIITPREPQSRGGHVSIMIKNGKCLDVHKALEEKGFVVDYRAPSVLRMAPSPLYSTFSEVEHFCNTLANIVSEVIHT